RERGRNQSGPKRAAWLPRRRTVATGRLIEAASLSEPPLSDKEDQGEEDQEEAQNACRGLIVPSCDLLVDRIGQGLVTKQRHSTKGLADIENHQRQASHDCGTHQRQRDREQSTQAGQATDTCCPLEADLRGQESGLGP